MAGRARLGLFTVLLLALAACSGPEAGTRPEKPVTPAGAGTAAKPVAARVIRVRVDEKNLLLAGEKDARRYLVGKLVALAAKQLTDYGFAPATATRLAGSGRFHDVTVAGRRARVAGQGEQEGRIIDTTLWHVAGGLEVILDDAAVARLSDVLASLPVDSLAAARQLWRYLQKLSRLQPERESLEKLRRRLARGWAAALEPVLAAVRGLAPDTAGLARQLQEVTRQLAEFGSAFPGSSRLVGMQKVLARSWWKWLGRLEPSAANVAAIDERLAKLRQAAGGHLPVVEHFLQQALELAWRDRLNRLDDQKQPFPSVRRDFIAFLQRFPRSRFYPELELRFVSRWVEHLLAVHPAGLAQLQDLGSEVRLLRERFPGLAQGRQVEETFGRHCLRLLGREKVADLEKMKQVEQVLQECEPALPPGMETLAVRQRLQQIAERLRNEREDRLERRALKGLTFFLEWDEAIRTLPFGKDMANWPGRGTFAGRWKQGSDAGSDCRCSLDPDEPCRVFEEDGPHGGYEVVARILEGRLAGVDLCNVYVGEKLPAVYRFLLRRYPRRHTRREANLLLGSGNGEVAFGRPPGLLVWLACQDGACSLRVRQAQAWARMRQQASQEAERLRQQRRQQRQERINRGWQAGDCVRWDCSAGCVYRGRVEKRQGKRYQVVVRSCREDARQVGTRVWVRAQELFDCN
ncbi:MAG: hypothetical protein DRI34_09080 [Deltaproteobacteria bacterium]|nr:MAG: hypothetical protein DRI34_09080 [Deltaproteobacteria bacterium]